MIFTIIKFQKGYLHQIFVFVSFCFSFIKWWSKMQLIYISRQSLFFFLYIKKRKALQDVFRLSHSATVRFVAVIVTLSYHKHYEAADIVSLSTSSKRDSVRFIMLKYYMLYFASSGTRNHLLFIQISILSYFVDQTCF